MIGCSSSMVSSSSLTQVPSESLKLERTWIGMLNLRAYSTERRARTWAPAAAISSISSYEMWSILQARATTLGLAV